LHSVSLCKSKPVEGTTHESPTSHDTSQLPYPHHPSCSLAASFTKHRRVLDILQHRSLLCSSPHRLLLALNASPSIMMHRTLSVSALFFLLLALQMGTSASASNRLRHNLRRQLQDATPQACNPADGEASCPEGFFCRTEDESCLNQEMTTLMGNCEQFNFRCAKIFRPVCGCNGNSFSNACLAASHGVSIASFGMCEDSDEDST
jgi:hypothetical protein